MPVVMMSGHGTIDSAVEATRIGATDFLEKPIALQKLLATVKKALKHETVPQKWPLTLDAFTRSPLLKDLKRRLEQAAAKTSVLLLKSASGSIAEICARTLQTHRTPWLDLSTLSTPLTQEMLQNASGGIVFIADLAQLRQAATDESRFCHRSAGAPESAMVAASSRSLAALVESGWDPLLVNRLGEVWVALPQLSGHADDVPEIPALLLADLAERGEVPLRHFSSGAQNALRLHRWQGDGPNCCRPSRTSHSRRWKMRSAPTTWPARCRPRPATVTPLASMFFDLPLREAREGFERLYFEYHLSGERGNMTRLAEKSGLERTHLYPKLRQLGLNIGRRNEERE